jgi:hypothetical protein
LSTASLPALEFREKIKSSKFNSQFQAFAVSSGLIPLLIPHPSTGDTMHASAALDAFAAAALAAPYQEEKMSVKYSNTQFDTYDDCLATYRAQPPSCTFVSSKREEFKPSIWNAPSIPYCTTRIQCSEASGTMLFSESSALYTNMTLLADVAVGQCNSQANVPLCTNIASNCASLERLRAGFEDTVRKLVVTPEALCQPFVKNPPYICTKLLPPSVPSILSQALAFFTSALAAAKTALFFSSEMRHKCQNKAPSKDDGAPGTNGDVKAQKGASKPSDVSVEMRSFQEEPFDKGSSSTIERIEARFEARFKSFETEQAEILGILQELSSTINGRAMQEVAASDADVSQAPHRAQARVIGALAPDRSRAKLLAPRASAQQGSRAGNPPNVSLPDALEIPQTPPRGRSSSRGRYAGNDGSRDA